MKDYDYFCVLEFQTLLAIYDLNHMDSFLTQNPQEFLYYH